MMPLLKLSAKCFSFKPRYKVILSLDFSSKSFSFNKFTDVISFALEDNPDIVYDDFRLLGDIYIAIDVAYDQAIEYNHSREREVCFLATHGVLHLLGYDHMTEEEEKEMFGLQEELLQEYGINR